MKILITGANGFIGKNLQVHLKEAGYQEIICIDRESTTADLQEGLKNADFIYHLAGINRPKDITEFHAGNVGLTEEIIAGLNALGRSVPIAYTSSIQAEIDNPYGASKSAAESVLREYQKRTGAAVYIYRLPNVFGKWCRPNYNSAVATFCHNTAHNLPITINDANAALRLVYIDDVCESFSSLLGSKVPAGQVDVTTVYDTTVGFVAETLAKFRISRDTLITEAVGTGLVRALYSTYVSYLATDDFSYQVPSYGDARGVFVEMLKTPDCGQFSFFTAHPGITRGGHYHHTKTEKFLVIKGEARFGFRHILTGERVELITKGAESRIVETIPGWAHDITNIGQDEMVVMLWANEIFDRQKPDTISHEV
ncbi:capsular polysaccharide biosynthesis protein CapF [Chitinibacter fontanus]|uniref:Capsular polysaccharide biosynthesis protein CapF n=1 Tax=Chitinibacter fontanus TaxID=1737446 RepID=A0A7D5Z9Y6_9NEIS|nr:capsular polysaccharide biosynthesis protein CapF [Chitinibacter fontanus]QLI80506.1 capsular polysaccharide biosynthesis protein CapF [Chitinibacter fontanus]